MKKNLFSTLTPVLFLLVSSFSFAQNTSAVKGKVIDGQTQLPVEFASVSVLHAADSAIVNGTITDSLGEYAIQDIPSGEYLLKISFIGYADVFEQNVQLAGEVFDAGIQILQADENLLEAVSVVGEKKVVETIPGGIVYNADQVLTNANSTVLDMLKNVPNVIVDKDEHVTIRGNAGIQVMLDDVPLNMNGDDLENFLKQLPANMISTVEVITTPGAKYDAAGSAGILNLRTKQNKASGSSGTLTAGAETIGSYNAGGNYYANTEKLRFSASYNFMHTVFEGISEGYRENFLSPEPLYFYDEIFTQNGSSDNHLGKIGLDYIINEKNTLGGNVSYGFDGGTFQIEDELISKYADGTVSGSYLANLAYNYTGDTYAGNMHYIKRIGEKQSDIRFDANYSHYANNTDIPSATDFFDADGDIIDGLHTSRNDTTAYSVDILTGKIDYTLPLSETSKFEAGIKHTHTLTENNLHAQIEDIVSGEWVNDTTVSNDFAYRENVSAGYVSFSSALKKLNYTLGLRSEYTLIHTESNTTGDTNTNNYLDFFPSANLKYPFKDGSEMSFDYSRRIERPVYQWLNPFVDKSTPYTWFTGNPELGPYYTNSFNLAYTKFIQMKHYLMASIFYQSMDNIFTQYFEYAGDGVYYLTIKNVNNQTNIGASVMLQSSVTKWFDLLVNTSAFQNSIKNELNGVDLDSKISANVYASATFKFWENASFQLTGNYMSPSTNPQGYFQGFYSVDAGLKKSFIQDKLTVNLSLKDIFNSMKFTNEFVDATFSSTYSYKPVSRVAGISLSWSFGEAIQGFMPEQKSDEEKRVNFGGRNG